MLGSDQGHWQAARWALRTEDVFELGGLVFALLEVAAEDDLLAVLSLVVVESRTCDCYVKHAGERDRKDVDHFDRYVVHNDEGTAEEGIYKPKVF